MGRFILKALLGLILAVLAFAVVNSIEDIRRYFEMRQM